MCIFYFLYLQPEKKYNIKILSMEKLNQDLDYYKNHPVYGLGYDSITEYMGILSLYRGLNIPDDDYLNVFREAEYCVDRVKSSPYPEREIPRIHRYISEKYASVETKPGSIIQAYITVDYCIGCLIELLFLVALCELMPERSDRVNRALVNMRSFIERHENSYIYKNYEIWKLVAERIPSESDCPRIEDLQVEIERLKSKYSNNVSAQEFESVKEENSELLQEMAQMKETISDLMKQLSEKDSKCDKLPEEEDKEDAKELCTRLKIAYIFQLCEFNPKVNVKNIRALSRSLSKICGVTRASVMNYLNDPVLKLNHHKDALNALNKDLRDAGLPELSTRLECE